MLGKDNQSDKYGDVAFNHENHTTKAYSPDGKTVISCVECHHTDQPPADLKPPLKTSERAVALTTASLDGGRRKDSENMSRLPSAGRRRQRDDSHCYLRRQTSANKANERDRIPHQLQCLSRQSDCGQAGIERQDSRNKRLLVVSQAGELNPIAAFENQSTALITFKRSALLRAERCRC